MQPILVKYCRIFSRLSQIELAGIVGVHQSLISKIEAGTIKMQPETERKLLGVFSEMGMDAQLILKLKQTIKTFYRKKLLGLKKYI